MKTPLLFVPVFALVLAASCASEKRAPSSADTDAQSVELAQRLRGGSLKFRAYRDGNDVSVLGFLELKFKNCEVKLNTDVESPDFQRDFQGSFVDCEIDLASDPLKAPVHAYVQGDKRQFKVHVKTEREGHYAVDANLEVVWQDHRWTGNGQVTGWIEQDVGRDTSLKATIKESLSF